jgi:hypothetical protein
MTALKVRLENCYGIKQFEYDFEFTDECRTYAVYAPNGVMKTSFAQTFKDLASKKAPRDRMDASLRAVYDALDESGNQVTPESICVIEPYNEKIFDAAGDKALTLLSNEDVRKEYRAIYDELDRDKQALIKQLKKISASSNCEEELYKTFAFSGETLFDVFEKILDKSKTSKERYDFKYNDVFDKSGKVKAFLDENRQLFDEYCTKYDELISGSDFFSKSGGTIFGTSEAKNLGDSVKGNEFFAAGHALNIKKYGSVGDNSGFKKIVDEEIDKIFNDEKLKIVFKKVEDKLNANKDLAAFKKVIEKDLGLVLKLSDYETFKKEVWYSYLYQMISPLEDIVDLYIKKKPALEQIIKKANSQRSKWENALEEFSDRFVNIPFTLNIEDKADAILNAKVPGITFKFKDKSVDRSQLLEVLSQGEKRAFYILNIIFEIRSRDSLGQKTLFIIDDIADSFDYKNKYAIIEYLNDIVKNDNFYSIILTHNFDFYRTISSRLGIDRQHKLHALKDTNEVKLIQEVYQKLPFTTWRNCMKSGRNYTAEDAVKHIIALVPFTRNLIEYSGKDTEISSSLSDTDYNILTSLLHSKDDTQTITFGNLKEIFNVHISKDDFDVSIRDSDLVYGKIIDVAGDIGDEEFNLENKIILAIAIRHKAEEYMVSKLTNTSPATKNQTAVFFDRYKTEFSAAQGHKQACRVLESVNIMTPENIHLNSFMYEPILDMGIIELKDLYKRVCDLI